MFDPALGTCLCFPNTHVTRRTLSAWSVCVGVKQDQNWAEICWRFFNFRRFRGWRGWLSIFPVNCGLSVLETAIDVETVYTYELCIYRPVGYVYTDLGVQNRKENVQI